MDSRSKMKTEILPVNAENLSCLFGHDKNVKSLDFSRVLPPNPITEDYNNLKLAAKAIQESDIPVAFPTETVYGLGADATRSSAVQGIYKAKKRPSDNPLIVHISSLEQLRKLLAPHDEDKVQPLTQRDEDSIPQIYHPLIQRYWPGPLTILLPLPKKSPFAPEVTAGLDTVGIRMPSSTIALALISLADRPIAAPSANASGRPSPTRAAHVVEDLDGRVKYVVDGGDVGCEIGVESTVVDGLSTPPAILRPGGVSLEALRTIPGWERCVKGYKDESEVHTANGATNIKPRAPGMKYRHYSPKARVILYEPGAEMPPPSVVYAYQNEAAGKIGVIRTRKWPQGLEMKASDQPGDMVRPQHVGQLSAMPTELPTHLTLIKIPVVTLDQTQMTMLDIELGPDLSDVARGLFSALRAIDAWEPSVIFVEGVDESLGHEAAAIMNRLRKAASA